MRVASCSSTVMFSMLAVASHVFREGGGGGGSRSSSSSRRRSLRVGGRVSKIPSKHYCASIEAETHGSAEAIERLSHHVGLQLWVIASVQLGVVNHVHLDAFQFPRRHNPAMTW